MQESVEEAVEARGKANTKSTLAEEPFSKVSASCVLGNLSCNGTQSCFYGIYACHLQVSVNCV